MRPVGFDSRTADHPDYAQRVAVPVMNAVDGLPPEYRAMVHEFGYVDVYRAWLHHVSPTEIRRRAEQTGGIYFYGTA